ncbi:S26 family signal peptidase [Amycolatopsis pigmentata]|uniref:S26 family signal peptidase n=1 Tax=Amycolatopsis pigmentata TaxID=450801 RepID=A0ABW5FPQ0_9PSEU
MTTASVPQGEISRGGLPTIATCCVRLASALFGRVVIVTVRGTSMEPAFRDGDEVLVHRRRALTAGAVVVVERPTHRSEWPGRPVHALSGGSALRRREWMIKRVLAAPGDPVPSEQVPALAGIGDQRVPPGKLVLLGDNRKASFDSRQLGYISAERVLGVVLAPCRPRRRA